MEKGKKSSSKPKKTEGKVAKKVEKKTKKKIEKKKEVTTKPKTQKQPVGLLVSEKKDLIKQFALKDGDTGSPEVQIALATHKILNLQQHLEQNPKDNHSRRGLLKVIAKRRRILNYLQKKDEKRHKLLLEKLGLKK